MEDGFVACAWLSGPLLNKIVTATCCEAAKAVVFDEEVGRDE